MGEGNEAEIAAAKQDFYAALDRMNAARKAENMFDAGNPLYMGGGDEFGTEGDTSDRDKLTMKTMEAQSAFETAETRLRSLGVDTNALRRGRPIPIETPTSPSRTGCSPRVIAAIAVIVAVVAGAIFVVFNNDDESGTVAADSKESKDEEPKAGNSNPSGGGDDVAVFAGTWTLASGLDLPNGWDVFVTDPGAYTLTLSPPSAQFTIESDGSVRGGSLKTHMTGSNVCGPAEFTKSADSATGSVGSDGRGTVTFTGNLTYFNCGGSPVTNPDGRFLSFWITGDRMFACRGEATSPTTCVAKPELDPPIVFTRAA